MNWRKFLLDEAYRDPEALVVVLAWRELPGSGRSGPAPAAVRPALRRWAASARRAKAGGKPPAAPGRSRSRALRDDGAGNLLVPFRDADGCLRALQAVAPDGRTSVIGDMRRPGLLCLFDGNRHLAGADAAPVAVFAHDYAVAAAVHAATGEATALAPSVAGVKASVAALRRRRSGCRVVVAGGARDGSRRTCAGPAGGRPGRCRRAAAGCAAGAFRAGAGRSARTRHAPPIAPAPASPAFSRPFPTPPRRPMAGGFFPVVRLR